VRQEIAVPRRAADELPRELTEPRDSSASTAERRAPEFSVFLNSPADVTQYRAAFDAFARWAGRPIDRYKLHVPWDQGWGNYESPFWLGQFDNLPVALLLPLFVAGASVDGVLAGEYDRYYRGLADQLIEHGLEDAVLVLGHEFNTDWFPWGTKLIGDDAYVKAFRHVRDVFMSRPGAAFVFDWTSVPGEANPLGAYPGDDYVDIVGSDFYDRDWEFGPWQSGDWYVRRWEKFLAQPWGLDWLAQFARERGKPISFGEWGLVTRDSDANAGGDNPYFVEQLFAWMASNNVTYQAYHNSDNPDLSHRLDDGDLPASADAYRDFLSR